ncbi:hypothetical protein [Streptomyces sp. NPDC102264]|uniref:hypothetical protein n=1 Tax=Streptomyces sp. NPDC102264 TaxID=3366149 RepID=UPI0037F87F07
MQTPSLGRVVHVLVNPITNNGSDIAPATVVRVGPKHADGSWSVNLKADLDASTTARWLTSVRLHADEETARGYDGAAAFWPPRVR